MWGEAETLLLLLHQLQRVLRHRQCKDLRLPLAGLAEGCEDGGRTAEGDPGELRGAGAGIFRLDPDGGGERETVCRPLHRAQADCFRQPANLGNGAADYESGERAGDPGHDSLSIKAAPSGGGGRCFFAGAVFKKAALKFQRVDFSGGVRYHQKKKGWI